VEELLTPEETIKFSKIQKVALYRSVKRVIILAIRLVNHQDLIKKDTLNFILAEKNE